MTRPRRPLVVLLLAVLVVIGWWWLRPRPDIVFQESLAAIRRGDQDAVLAGIAALEDYPGYDSHVHLLRGAYLLGQGNAAAALQSFENLVPEGELKRPALELTGECLYKMQQLPLAAAQYQELLKDNPNSTNAHRWLGQIFYNLGAFDTAVAHLQELVKYEPNNYLAYALMGHMAFDFEDYEISVKNYKQALSLDRPASVPTSVHQEVLRNLAQSLIGQNSYPEAMKILRRADQGHALVLALQADCHRGLGDPQKAREFLERALEADPLERRAVLLQVDLAIDDQQAAATIEPLERILTRDPHDIACRFQLAQSWQRLKEPEKYKREMARYEESRRLKKELTELNLDANRDPRNAEVRDKLAGVCEKLGKLDLAVMWRLAAAACRQLPRPKPR